MKARSLQVRMTAGFVGILMLVLIGYGAIFYRAADELLTQQADHIGVAIWAKQYHQGVKRAKGRLLMLYGVTIPVVVLLAALGGLAVAKMGIRPLVRLTRAAREIDSGHLDRSIPLSGADDELDDLTETLNEMLGRLRDSFARIQRFTANASHELRTPLTAIRGEIEVTLRRDRSPEEYRQVLGELLEHSNWMTRLTEDLMTLARADSGQIAMDMQPVNLLELLTDARDQVLTATGSAAERIALDPVSEHFWVRGDRLWLCRMVTNLLENGLKYSPAPRQIQARCCLLKETNEVLLEVIDQGEGIPESQIGRIFEPFFRLSSPQSIEGSGTGLGLSMVAWIVRQHHGRVSVRSAPGEGSTFSVRLNRIESPTP